MDAHDKDLTVKSATARLFDSFSGRTKRRSLIKGAVAGVSGLALLGATAPDALAHAQKQLSPHKQDSVVEILTVARTAEQLAVTFYSHGIANADKLGLTVIAVRQLKAALVEEQIHQLFFTANGGQSLATTFSFPKGQKTFEDLDTFIETQQQLEGVFDSAFLAAIKEFSELGHSDLAQIAGQIACIESEHRVLGRAIGRLEPADNWAYAPVLIARVRDAPGLVKDAGYLSPRDGNSYTYQEVSTDEPGVVYRKPFAVSSTTAGKG